MKMVYSMGKLVFAQRRACGSQKFRNQVPKDSFLTKNYKLSLKLLFIPSKDQFCSMPVYVTAI